MEHQVFAQPLRDLSANDREGMFRLRYDAGYGDNRPDRAEFFYAKCGCYRDLPSSDPAFDASAPGPRPGAADVLNYQQLYLDGEYAVKNRVSFFAELPVRWIQPQSFIPGTSATCWRVMATGSAGNGSGGRGPGR